MSAIANSCEYLTPDKECLAVFESEKAKESRQLNCENPQKTTCCYICPSRPTCAISCRYLGRIETDQAAPEMQTPKPLGEKEVSTAASAMVCPCCNGEMNCGKTKLAVEGLDVKDLSVLVYVCRVCGKIEFKAESTG
ncbi:MAG: hypothetical protein NWE93_14770 [Candidatus Bathyarchaeota archaeon]|nr:hypothetical protein [Candidatus Bathyarchaeota archaeon]